MKVVFPAATAALLLGAFSDANAEKSNLRRRTQIIPTSSSEDVIGDVSSLAALSSVQLSDFDTDADGELSIVEFINALQAAGISMTLEEVESLFASLDTSGNTLVRIQDLVAAIEATSTTPVSNADIIGDVSSLAALSSVQLSDFDTDADGELSIVEFINALQAAGISMTLEEVESLFASLDTSGNTLVRIQDLVAAIEATSTTPVSNADIIGDVSSLAALSSVQLSDFDTDADGELSIVEFINALQAAGISMTLEEVESLFASLDTSGNTLVRIQDLVAAIEATSTTPVSNADTIGDVSSLAALSSVQLSDFDTDADGELSIVEFINALQAAGISMTLEEVESLFASLDTSGNTLVRIQDLVAAIEATSTTPVSNADIIGDVSSLAALSSVQLSDFDTDADGELSIVEFINALQAAGISMTLEEVESLFASLDTSGNTLVRIQDLVAAIEATSTTPVSNADTIGDVSSLAALSSVQLSDFDTDADGELSIVEFINALQAAGISMTLEEVESLFASSDTSGNTLVRIQDLVAAIAALPISTSTTSPTSILTPSPTVSAVVPASKEDTIGDISGLGALSSVQLSDFDDDADGELTIVEFINALEAAGITMTLEEVEALFGSLDTSGNVLVRIQDLEAAIVGRVDTIGDVSSIAALSTVQLSDFDTDADGELAIVEFINALEAAGISMTLEEVEALFASLDTSGNTSVRIEDLDSAVASTIGDVSSIAALLTMQLSDFDTDADGELDIVEFITALEAAGITMTLEEVEALFASLDTSGNALVPIQDLQTAIAGNALSSVQLSDFDDDADSELSIVEFINALQAASISMTLEEAETLFASLDTSGNALVPIQDLEGVIVGHVDTIGDISSIAALSTVQLSDFDTDADGELTIVEFINALEAAGITMTLEEVETLFASLDTSGNALVRIQDLEVAIADIVDTIGDVSSIAALSTVQLSDFDTDADGELTIVEFINALEAAGITMTLEEVETLFASLDTSGNALVRIQDLEVAIVEIVDTIGDVSSIAALSTVQLSDFDTDADGELTIVEFINALEAAGITMTLEEVETLFASLDTNGNAMIRIQDLESAVEALLTNIDPVADLMASLQGIDISTFDLNSDGLIGPYELTLGLVNSGVSATTEEIFALRDSLDLNGDGFISIAELNGENNEEGPASINAITNPTNTNLAEAISTLDVPSFDSNSDGEITAYEFTLGLINAGVSATPDSIYSLVNSFDMNSNGRVGIIEYQTSVVLESIQNLNLNAYDTDSNGKLNIVEFTSALVAGGVKNMSIEQLQGVFGMLDSDGDNFILLNELEALVADNSNIDLGNFSLCGNINLFQLGESLNSLMQSTPDLSSVEGAQALKDLLETL